MEIELAGQVAAHRDASRAIAALIESRGEDAHPELPRQHGEHAPGDTAFRADIAAAYRREAGHSLQRSAALALINGLEFDDSAEHEIIASFAAILDEL